MGQDGAALPFVQAGVIMVRLAKEGIHSHIHSLIFEMPSPDRQFATNHWWFRHSVGRALVQNDKVGLR